MKIYKAGKGKPSLHQIHN